MRPRRPNDSSCLGTWFQVVQTNVSLGEKDEQLKKQLADLQDFDVYKNDYKRVHVRYGGVPVGVPLSHFIGV